MIQLDGEVTAMKIESWYDRKTKNYITQAKDDEGNQIGEALISGNKEDRKADVEALRRVHMNATRMDDYISLGEWARLNGIDPATARQRALRGVFDTAKKIGGVWIIDKHELLVDHRKKGN